MTGTELRSLRSLPGNYPLMRYKMPTMTDLQLSFVFVFTGMKNGSPFNDQCWAGRPFGVEQQQQKMLTLQFSQKP